MKTYTVHAKCRFGSQNYTLRHDGEDWSEKFPYEETSFETLEEAQKFAAEQSEHFEVSHEMVITEDETEEEEE